MKQIVIVHTKKNVFYRTMCRKLVFLAVISLAIFLLSLFYSFICIQVKRDISLSYLMSKHEYVMKPSFHSSFTSSETHSDMKL